MSLNSFHVRRTTTIIEPDLSRVLLRPFTPGDLQRVTRIVERILSLTEDQVDTLLDEVSAEFSERHLKIIQIQPSRASGINAQYLRISTLDLNMLSIMHLVRRVNYSQSK